MQDFAQFLNHQAENIHTIFISDLHLNQNQPALMQAFLAFLEHILTLKNIKRLFILGDWFDTWLGDDMLAQAEIYHWLRPMIDKLQKLSQQGCQILVMTGNRDFLLGQKFCQLFFAKKLHSPYYLTHHRQIIRLEHGDVLCTEDQAYQYFRQIIQHNLTKSVLLTLPLTIRQKIGTHLRKQSQMKNTKKSYTMMDVTTEAVDVAIKNVDALIHGHTHRPAIHSHDHKQRVVLGDWRQQKTHMVAEVGCLLYDVERIFLLQYRSDLAVYPSLS